MKASSNVALALFALLPVACDRPPPPKKVDLAETSAFLEGLSAKYRPLDEARRAAVAQAHGTLVARPDLGRCPVTLSFVSPLRPNKGFDPERMKRQLHTLERVDLDFRRGEDLAKAPGRLFTSFKSSVAGAKQWPKAEAEKHLARFDAPGFWDWDLVIVEGPSKRARALDDGKSFEGGYFRGIAYLYSFEQKKVLCMADIAAKTPSKVTVRTYGDDDEGVSKTAAMQADSTMNFLVLEQATASLVLAGPPQD